MFLKDSTCLLLVDHIIRVVIRKLILEIVIVLHLAKHVNRVVIRRLILEIVIVLQLNRVIILNLIKKRIRGCSSKLSYKTMYYIMR